MKLIILGKPPKKDFGVFGEPILMKYPHSGRCVDSLNRVRKKLCFSEDGKSNKGGKMSETGKRRYLFHDFIKFPFACMVDLLHEYPLHQHNVSPRDLTSFMYYEGPKGSGTIMHAHGQALNILSSGTKRWIIMPPSKNNKKLLSDCGYNVSSEKNIDRWLKYHLRKIETSACGLLDFIQHAGEAVYIPSGWYHAVLNLSEVRGNVYTW